MEFPQRQTESEGPGWDSLHYYPLQPLIESMFLSIYSLMIDLKGRITGGMEKKRRRRKRWWRKRRRTGRSGEGKGKGERKLLMWVAGIANGQLNPLNHSTGPESVSV